MVRKMIEKKDPHEKIRPVDLDDDDDIIELTDEVFIKPKVDDEIIDLQGTGTALPKTPADIQEKMSEKEPKSDDEDDIIDLAGTPEIELQAPELGVDLGEVVSDHDGTLSEDDMIASAIVESLGTEDDDLPEDEIKLTGEADTKSAQDDDVIILDTDDDEASDALSDQVSAAAEQGVGVFDTEEEIELEYESNEDEYDFFALDDKQTLEELETISMADEDPADAGDDDIPFDPVSNLDLNPDADDGIIAMDSDPSEGPGLVAFEDEETLEFGGGGDLPDLTDELEFEFDDEDGEKGFAAAHDRVAEDSDDIIARSVEKTLSPDEDTTPIDMAMEPEFEFGEDRDMMAEAEYQATEEDLAAATREEIRELAEAGDLPDIDDDFDLKFEDDDGDSEVGEADDLEPEDEVLPMVDFDASTAEGEDDIIEITEFDEHFPEADEKRLELAGVLDATDEDEDDFLELIEVEEDDSVEDEEVIAFNNSEEQIDEDEIDNFFSETIAEEPAFENEELDLEEEEPESSTDMAMATAAPADGEEEFDFSFDSSEISEQVDRLDTFLSDDLAAEPEVASLPQDRPVGEENGDEPQPTVEDTTGPLPVTPDQLDSILKDVIKDKFGGKIENIIYEVIEKAVSKEIDRLKAALIDSAGPGDNE